MFSEQLGKTMEVYIDDMLVKSSHEDDHVGHLKDCFSVLNKYGMKLNPAKCTFAVTSGEFLGYLVTQRGIEANPRQLTAIINMKSPATMKDVQRLTGRIAALSRFISRSTDKCLPFYQKLRSNKKFEWDDSCEEAFQQLKAYLTTPPILSKPEVGEMLYLYIAVSDVAVSGVLVREEGREQKPIFYISKSLAEAEKRYMMTEKLALAVVTSARKLRPYFQSHRITVLSEHPLRAILHSPTQSGRLTRWAIELSEYDIDYKPRTAMKAQVLADFIIEATPEHNRPEGQPELWTLHVDGSSSTKGSGIGVQLASPAGDIIEQSFRLSFPASNNEAEYEALLAGLRLARSVSASRLKVYCDSQLVANQFNGEYEARDHRMTAYLKKVQEIAGEFDEFTLTKVPRKDNSAADALAALASTSEATTKRVIPIETLETPSICNTLSSVTRSSEVRVPKVLALHEDDLGNDVNIEALAGIGDGPDWRNEIRGYIADGAVPDDKWQARKLKQRCARYTLHKDLVFRRSDMGVLLYCVHGDEIRKIIAEVHSGVNGNHAGGRSLAQKIRKQGYYWPTMERDCQAYAQKCERCQRHAPIIHQPAELMKFVTTPYPFMRWAMDIVGPLHKSDKKEYLLVLTDYFTKWVEAEAYAKITSTKVIDFLWKNILCRHGIPSAIVTDNGPQFTSKDFEHFCATYKITIQYSTPHNPQGNGQAEATNRRIVEGLKKRLTAKKGSWSFELDGVLWAHRTTPRRGTQQSPYSMVYGVEAVIPAEVRVPTLRRRLMPNDEATNNELLRNNLDTIEEQRELANIRMQAYQNQVARHYNKNVKTRRFQEGDLVLRKVVQNTSEYKAGKLGANWEGPYSITRAVHPGVYELARMDGTPEQRPWSSANLKKYYY